MTRLLATILILVGYSFTASAETESDKPKHWYERINLRGYAQVRYNRLFTTNPNLTSDQGDKSIGDKNGLFLRRARLIFSGDVGKWISIYIQPDFSSSPSSGVLNFAQLRDWYADIFFDEAKEFRLRAGQSKIPFGFENLQSSQNRLPMDRADALNSGIKDERDIGLFFYWAPAEIRKRFKYLVDTGLKGSGDYGVFGLGLYNGQTANRSEANNNLHVVARATYPYQFEGGQIVEASVQAYHGLFTVTKGTGAAAVGGPLDVVDQRIAGSLILYPQPIGVQVEYVLGDGPRLNAAQTAIEKGSIEGGYFLVNYRLPPFIPFVRYHYYLGGRKHETNAPFQRVTETELGLEWQIMPELELTGMYAFTQRTSLKAPYLTEIGRMARFQLQWNF